MIKKIIGLLLLFLLIFSISSCNLIVPQDYTSIISTNIEKKPWLSTKTALGKSLTYDVTQDEAKEYLVNLEEGTTYVDAENYFDRFKQIYEKGSTYYYNVSYASEIEYLIYSVYGNAENYDKFLAFDQIRIDIIEWFNKVEHKAFKNSFKSKLWPNMSDEEILDEIGEEYPKRYYEIVKEMREIETSLLELDYSATTFVSTCDILYVKYLTLAKEICEYVGSNEYLEYIYKHEYNRDYHPNDTNSFFDNVIKYVLPYCLSAYDNYSYLSSLLTRGEAKFVEAFLNETGFDPGRFSYIESYKEFVGGIFKETFDNLFTEGGAYFISFEPNGQESAFQANFSDGNNTPYVFYGPGYSKAISIIHEFGHYFNSVNGSDEGSYDLMETHSQANEYLFLNYLAKYTNLSDTIKNTLLYYHIYDSTETILISSIVNEVEKICYNKDNPTTGEVTRAVNQIYQKYPALSNVYNKTNMIKYASYVTLYSPGYYISYATSLVGSLNISKIAQDSFDDAKNAYYKLVIESIDYGFKDSYINSGLKDPFTEEAFKYIFE